MTEIRKYILLFFISLLLELAVTPIRGGYFSLLNLTGFSLSMLIGAVVFFAFTFFLIKYTEKKLKPKYTLWAILAGVAFIELPLTITRFESTLISQPEYYSRFIAVLLAYGCFKAGNTWEKILIVAPFSALFLWMAYFGYEKWSHKVYYGTWDGRLSRVEAVDNIVFQNSDGDNVGLSDFQGKYLVLDFWITRCGVCFRAFPKVEELYRKYINSPGISIYGVHGRIETDDETCRTGEVLLLKHNYTFPCLSLAMDSGTQARLGVTFYPMVLIIDPQGRLAFRGQLENAVVYLDNLTKR